MARFAWLATALVMVGCDCSAGSSVPCCDGEAGTVDAGTVDAGSDAHCAVQDAACDGGSICPDGGCVAPPCELRACLTALRDDAGVCVYTPVTDGIACEDGDACTDGDQCEAGACIGTGVTSEPATRGVAMSFGAEPIRDWMEGLAAFVADDRIVFLESTGSSRSHLSLVRVDDSGIVRLSEAESRVPFVSVNRSIIYWGRDAVTHVLSMGAERFVVVTGHRSAVNTGMEVFSFANDALESLAFTPLPGAFDSAAFTIDGAAAREDALFVCGTVGLEQRLRAYTLDDTTSLFSLAGDTVQTIEGCNALALSPDGNLLYVAAAGGYRVYDVRDPTNFAVPASGHWVTFSGHYLDDIEVSADHVVVSVTEEAGDLGNAFLFSAAGTLVGPLAPPAGTDAVPFGIAMAGSDLFVEWYARGTSTYVAAFHDLDAPGPPVLAQQTFQEGRGPETQVTPVARGDLAVLQPTRRVMRLDRGSDTLEERTGPAHGSMRTLLAGAVGEVLAFGPASTQRVDITDPDAPVVVAGGVIPSLANDDNQLLLAAPGTPAALVSPRPSASAGLEQHYQRERFTLVDGSVMPPVALGRAYVDGPSDGAVFGFRAGRLFQVIPQGTQLHVRRFQSAAVAGLANEAWPVDLQATLPGVDLPSYPNVRLQAVGVSESGEDVLIVASRWTQAIQFVRTLTWLRVTQDGMSILAEASFPSDMFPWAIDIAFVNGGAIVVGSNSIARISVDGATLRLDVMRPMSGVTMYQRILDANDERILVTRHDWAQTNGMWRHIWAVDTIGVLDLSTSFTYDTPDEVQSVLVRGTSLYFGMSAGLLVATPACGP